MHAWGALGALRLAGPGAVQPRYSVALRLDIARTAANAQAPPVHDSRFVSRQLAETDERVIFVSAISTMLKMGSRLVRAILLSTSVHCIIADPLSAGTS